MSDSDDDGAFASADEGDPELVPLKKASPVSKTTMAETDKPSKSTESEVSSAIDEKSSELQQQASSGSACKKKTVENDGQKGKKAKKKNKGGEKQMPQKKDNKDTCKAGKKSGSKPEKKTPPGKIVEKESNAEVESVGPSGDAKEEKAPNPDTEESEKQIEDSDKKEELVSGVKKMKLDSEEKLESSQKQESSTENTEEGSTSTTCSNKSDEPKIGSPAKVKEESQESREAELMKSPSSQDIPRPEPDQELQPKAVLEKLADAAGDQKKASGGGWGWGSWGSSLLDVASNSVSTFTSQVGEGFSTVLETVESTLKVPSPEEMAGENISQKPEDDEAVKERKPDESSESSHDVDSSNRRKEVTEPNSEGREEQTSADDICQPSDLKEPMEISREENPQGLEDRAGSGGGWFSSWGVSNITNMVQNTSKKLVTGSLDVLETVGKKTFDVIKDHDPGLKKTRGLISNRGNKPNLSLILREAKEQSEEMARQEKESEESRKVHFGTLFDEFQGLAHLEALEILSNQSEKKLGSLLTALPPEVIASIKPQLLEIKQCFEIVDEDEDEDEEDEREHDFTGLLTNHVENLQLPLHPEKLKKTQTSIRGWITDFSHHTEEDKDEQAKMTHQTAIRSLAEMTSKSIEQFHKIGELVLLPSDTSSKDCVHISKTLSSLTQVLTTEIGILSTKFSNCLNACSESNENSAINTMVTNVYLEATNSSSYIQDGFQLLLPVIQQVAIEQTQSHDS